MAIQQIGDVTLPPLFAAPNIAFAFSSGPVFDAASEAAGTIFQAPKTGNIRFIHWATRTVTTGATIDVRLETVSTTDGTPSGTLVGTNTNNNAVVVGSGDDNTFFSTQLTADAAVTRGQLVALVISNPAASFGNMTVAGASWGYDQNLPYSALRQASWALGISSFLLMFSVEYDDGTIVPIPGITPVTNTLSVTNLSTSTTPDVAGLRFQLPIAARVLGGWVTLDDDGDFDLKLVTTAYNQGAGTGILASVSRDKDTRRSATGAGMTMLYFTGTVDIAAATNYRLVVEPTTTTAVVFRDINAPSLNVLNAWPGGSNFHLTTAKDPTADGDWTNYNSGTFRMPAMGLILGGFDDTGGGAGGGASRARVQRRM